MLNLIGYSSLVLLVIKASSACPSYCICKWKNGKQTVECSRKNLQDIPDGLDPGTQVLDLGGNSLQLLSNELFSKKQLINLQRIYLPECKIKKIDEGTFKGLTNLVELDLSGNILDIVPTVTFLDCPSLMRLTLSRNPIKTLKKFAFNHLSYLNTLELSNCELEEVEEGAFQDLNRLEWLFLDRNRLRTIRGSRTLPENLKGVELQSNAWQCDCHIQDLYVWLKNFKISLSVDPICSGPSRLADRVIKSIPATELACLPDISPTSFYLELAEGRNISLMCHVHAVPEASVSWWFQGQILQNNTIVAPGIRLIYFVEEGVENKRSELFIYNANSEDNGTFICNAENAAGTSQSNFTIKIIIKEDPIVIIVSFPFEYLIAALVGAVALGFVILVVIAVLILKCRRRSRYRRAEKREKSKSVSLQYQQNSISNKQEEMEPSPDPLKIDNKNCDVEVMLYNVRPGDELLSVISPVGGANQLGSPSSLRRYQLEQNPDLINGTESIGCRREDHDPTLQNYNDVRWNMIDSKGYPLDYGLPKIASCRYQPNEHYYRTLPTNRIRRQTAANPTTRYSQEAEFLTRNQATTAATASASSAIYDHYHTADIRYTADGYPARTVTPSPQSLPCCSVQWPPCLPANLHLTNSQKRCVSAQTDARDEKAEPNGPLNDTLTESPDEGYGGEPSVV